MVYLLFVQLQVHICNKSASLEYNLYHNKNLIVTVVTTFSHTCIVHCVWIRGSEAGNNHSKGIFLVKTMHKTEKVPIVNCSNKIGNYRHRKLYKKISLTLMGVLAPGSAPARPSARPPIDTSGNFSVACLGCGGKIG